MKILVLGGYGFIGSYLALELYNKQHEVVIGGRDVNYAKQRLPFLPAVHYDSASFTSVDRVSQYLAGFDMVINCVGILQANSSQEMRDVHVSAPKALFAACNLNNIKLIHFSALGADLQAHTDYASSKQQAEEHLKSMEFDWVCLRPSLVIAPGSYGGTSLLRGFAGLPIIPVVNNGKQLFQAIAMADVVAAVITIIEKNKFNRQLIELVGPQKLTMREIIAKLRSWLGFGNPRFISVPFWLAKIFCKVGDIFKLAPFNSTSLAMMTYGNTSERSDMVEQLAITPKSMTEYLRTMPSSVQDRWHAKLYFFRIILRLTLSGFWIISGMVPYLSTSYIRSIALLERVGFSHGMQRLLFFATTLWDIFLGISCLCSSRLKAVLILQMLTLLGYTLMITAFAPSLWLDPLGAVVKNIPALFSIIALYLIAQER